MNIGSMDIQKIGMITSYRNLAKRADWLWQQTPQQFGIWQNIQIQALSGKPDFLLMYQFDFPKDNQQTSLIDKLRQC